jgi:hypothetical protein
MLDENRDIWVAELKSLATDTLAHINQKAKDLGQYAVEDEGTVNLCMGYLYLLDLCNKNELFVQDQPSWYLIKDIDKKQIIH